jgi:hypothetical protein
MANGNNRQGGGYRDEGRGLDDRRDNSKNSGTPASKPKAVYALTEREERTYWTRIGVAFVNRDDSITVCLEALPLSGRLQIRDEGERGERE